LGILEKFSKIFTKVFEWKSVFIWSDSPTRFFDLLFSLNNLSWSQESCLLEISNLSNFCGVICMWNIKNPYFWHFSCLAVLYMHGWFFALLSSLR
jgi:hypothetical protein